MMPLAPVPMMSVPSKPKIGFSIDSIVGGGAIQNSRIQYPINNKLSEKERIVDYRISDKYEQTRLRSRSVSPSDDEQTINPGSPGSDVSVSSNHNPKDLRYNGKGRSPSKSPTNLSKNSYKRDYRRSPTPQHSDSKVSMSPRSSISPGRTSVSPRQIIVRPSALPPGSSVPFGNDALKGLYLPEPMVHGVPPPHHHPHPLALAAAAQHFQAGLAAAIAQHQNPSGFLPGGPPGHLPPGHPGHHGPPPPPRDTYPLYPWLLSRHGRIFPHRFPGGPDIPGFLLQPFRKPKRIRTAFSPSQLLKLEHAFEKNHYVVGAERKQLAQALSLTETQVKVWFQNRRTKHKRMQQEEEAKAQQQAAANNKNSHHVTKWKQETQSSSQSTTGQDGTQYIEYDEDDIVSSEEET